MRMKSRPETRSFKILENTEKRKQTPIRKSKQIGFSVLDSVYYREQPNGEVQY